MRFFVFWWSKIGFFVDELAWRELAFADMMHDDRYQSDIPADAEERTVPTCAGSAEKLVEYLIDGMRVGTRCWDEDGYLTVETPYKDELVHGVKYTW